MRGYYLLEGREPKLIDNFLDWASKFEKSNVVIQKTSIGESEVSTVFLGVDHRYSSDGGEPILFETMIFGGEEDGYQQRCSTYFEAEKMHKEVCDMLLKPTT